MKAFFTRNGIMMMFTFQSEAARESMYDLLGTMGDKDILQVCLWDLVGSPVESLRNRAIIYRIQPMDCSPILNHVLTDCNPWIYWLLNNRRIIQISKATDNRYRVEGLSECENALLLEHVASVLDSF